MKLENVSLELIQRVLDTNKDFKEGLQKDIFDDTIAYINDEFLSKLNKVKFTLKDNHYVYSFDKSDSLNVADELIKAIDYELIGVYDIEIGIKNLILYKNNPSGDLNILIQKLLDELKFFFNNMINSEDNKHFILDVAIDVLEGKEIDSNFMLI